MVLERVCRTFSGVPLAKSDTPCVSLSLRAMYAVSFGNCLRWMGCDGSRFVGEQFSRTQTYRSQLPIQLVPQLATMNCTVPVRMSSRMRLWSRCERVHRAMYLLVQSSVSGNFVTIRWSGFIRLLPSIVQNLSRFGSVPG